MTSQEVAEAVVAWARATIPALKKGYGYPAATTGTLPDVMAVVQRPRTVPSDPEFFPFDGLEQHWLKEWQVELSIGVEQADGEAGAKAAHESLEGYSDALMDAALDDVTLGERVQMVSPRIEVDLAQPFHAREDGTRVREMYMDLVIAEPFELVP